ncbi:MAG: DNA polymerase thumb domain-containing protein [Minisyncoccales bacterium]
MLAKIASEEKKPNGLFLLRPNEVKEFLNSKSIRIIPGVGPKTEEKLKKEFKIKTVKGLREISKNNLKKLIGSRGEDLYEKARGVDKEPVKKKNKTKSIGREFTFKEDTRDPEVLLNTFEKLIKKVYDNLKSNNFYFKTVTVICRTHSFNTYTRSNTIKKPSDDLEILRSESKKLLLKFLTKNLKPLRLIGVRVKVVKKK